MNPQRSLASALSFALLASAACAADWPCYLGPNRDLTSAEKGLKLWSGDTAKVLWRKNVGSGHSSVVVVGQRLYTQGAGGELLVAGASPAGFKQIACASVLSGTCWTVPVVADGRVYCRNQAGDLVGVDLR